jgi:hypothetical protein
VRPTCPIASVIEKMCDESRPRDTASTYDPGSVVVSAAVICDGDEDRTVSCSKDPPRLPRYTRGARPKFAPSMVTVGVAVSRPAMTACEMTKSLEFDLCADASDTRHTHKQIHSRFAIFTGGSVKNPSVCAINEISDLAGGQK